MQTIFFEKKPRLVATGTVAGPKNCGSDGQSFLFCGASIPLSVGVGKYASTPITMDGNGG